MSKPVKVRFAPSPTGRLHIGNIRPAVFNWLFAKAAGGAFLLRFDDTDLERSKEEYVEGIRDDLNWLGLTWDESSGSRSASPSTRRRRRSSRGRPPLCLLRNGGRAGAAAQAANGTRQASSLRPRRAEAHGGGEDGVRGAGPQAALALSARTQAHAWDDLIRGPQEIDAASISDPVLIREDGTPLYTFTSVADDADVGITHIIRGEDHVTNTAVQIQLFEALGAAVPAFAHHNLLTGAHGEALSKRLGSLSIAGLREEGLEPLAVMTHASLIGTSDPLQPHESLEALAKLFNFGKVSRAPAALDPEELKGLNAKLSARHALRRCRGPVHRTENRRRRALLACGARQSGSLRRCGPVVGRVHGKVEARYRGCRLHGQALALLPPEPWDAATWSKWTEAVKKATGAKGRALFHPCGSR